MSLSISRAAVFSSDRVYVLAYRSEEEGTRVFRWMAGKWDNYHLPFVTAGLCAVKGSAPEILSLGVAGEIHSAGPSGQYLENLDLSDQGPVHRGALRAIRSIGSSVFVTGMGRQVYRRNSETRKWERIDDGVVDPIGSAELNGFECVDGFGSNQLWFAGLNGEIYGYESKWGKAISPTHYSLHAILCAPNGNIYTVGRNGTIVVGDGTTWRIIPQNLTDDTFWDLAWFDGAVWISSKNSLFCLKDDKLVNASPNGGGQFRYLASGVPEDKVLWSLGEQEIWVCDAGAWSSRPLPTL